MKHTTRIVLTTAFALATLGTACVEMDTDEELSTETSAAVIATDAFVDHHVVRGFTCPFDEVMVGVHLKDQKVICAGLAYGYRIADTYVDHLPYLGGPNTQVSSSPSMHGCRPNHFIQSFDRVYGGQELTCVELGSFDGPVTYSGTSHDGRGPSNNGTQSVSTYGLSPNMHVCPHGSAMAGMHVADNDLYCAR